MSYKTRRQHRGVNIAYESGANIASGQTSDPIYVDQTITGARGVSVGTKLLTSNKAKVQFTISPRARVEAGTANWHDWSHGDSNQSKTEFLVGPVTAVRCVSTGGDTEFEVLGV